MSKTMRIEHPHGLSDEEAKARLHALGEYFTNKHGIKVQWSGDRAQVAGKYMIVAIEGQLWFEAGKAVFEGKDPGMLWRSKAKDYIAGKLKTYLDPSIKVEDLKRT
jgi:hypothetical protein